MTTSLKRASALFFAGLLALAGCSGEQGDTGARGPQGEPGGPGEDLAASAKPESCVVCHDGAGAAHQAVYDSYTDASRLAITIDSIATDLAASLSTMTVSITLDGQPYVDANGLPGLTHAVPGSTRPAAPTFYATTYNAATRKFDTTVSYGGAKTTAVDGTYTVTAKEQTNGSTGTDVKSPLSFRPENGPAIAFAYVFDNPMMFEAFQVFNDVAHDGREFGAVAYDSAANDAGCQKCHGTPYMKHGYRVAHTPGLDDFAACKICHFDTRNGGHQAWQLLADDPAAYAAQDGEPTAEQDATFAYTASVMNDVHMSHAMEFAYPQSMANCVTCHEGKLDMILTDANFTLATCKSCHPVTGPTPPTAKRAPGLATVVPHAVDLYDYTGTACNGCHAVGEGAPLFRDVHAGYDKLIYADETTKYADAFVTAITTASKAGDVLSFTFTVTESPDVAGVSVDDVQPIAYFAPYGYDAKDFILAALNQDFAAAAKTGFTKSCTVAASVKTCTVSVDLATVSNGTSWTDRIADTSIRRLELGVRPKLPNPDGIEYYDDHADPPGLYASPVALDFATRTFDLAGAFADGYYAPIVDPAKCNKCHDALATTFHTADRGGNVVGCRVCHVTLNGGSHLEMQSRSIDSYVHAIHSFQPFDFGDVDFDDPVAELGYEHHVASTYPNFTIRNCESCHYAGTYEVPDQSRSLPGLHSKADANATHDRNIGAVPSYVTGPASRACGACHRAMLINADDASGLAAFNEHTKANGYLLDAATSTVQAAIDTVMAWFE
jgi:hypothetical protein